MEHDATQTPAPEAPLEKINIVLPEGYVMVKEADLRALEAKLDQKLGKIGITKRNKKESKTRRVMAKNSRRINRGKK